MKVWVGPSTSTGVRPGPRSPESVLRTRADTRYAAPLSTATVEEIRPSQASSSTRQLAAGGRGKGRGGKTRPGRRQSRTAPRRPQPRPHLGKKKRETKKHRQRFGCSKSRTRLSSSSIQVDEPPRQGGAIPRRPPASWGRSVDGQEGRAGGQGTCERGGRTAPEQPNLRAVCRAAAHAAALPASCDLRHFDSWRAATGRRGGRNTRRQGAPRELD